jgi:hypothetical protein
MTDTRHAPKRGYTIGVWVNDTKWAFPDREKPWLCPRVSGRRSDVFLRGEYEGEDRFVQELFTKRGRGSCKFKG